MGRRGRADVGDGILCVLILGGRTVLDYGVGGKEEEEEKEFSSFF